MPSAPRSVRVIGAGETSLWVTWSPPQPINGVLRQYRLLYWQTTTTATTTAAYNNDNSGGGAEVVQIVAVLATVNSFNITDLNPATGYSVQVLTYT